MIIQKEFYFIRHGQTDHNKAANKGSQNDIPLNETGRKQAQEIESIIATLPIKTICFSPLKRAKETKEIITARLIAEHYELPSLIECSGQIWNEMTRIQEKHPESVKSFMEQAVNGLNQALALPGPVLIVAHGGIHWAICYLMKVDHEWAIDNCVPVHFTYGEDGKWRARKLT